MDSHGQMVLASRLTDGRVVFLAPDGDWVEDIRQGAVAASGPAADELLARARAQEAANRVVEPYLITVDQQGDRRRPVAWREAIRTLGPTVRTDQAARGPA